MLELLRDELQQYGEMLALLEEQQQLVIARAADDVLRSVAAIHTQMGRVRAARRERERCQRELAVALGLAGEVRDGVLVSRLPEAYRPAVEALMNENNALLAHVRRRALRNHESMNRSMNLMERFVSSLLPASEPFAGAGHDPWPPAAPAEPGVPPMEAARQPAASFPP